MGVERRRPRGVDPDSERVPPIKESAGRGGGGRGRPSILAGSTTTDLAGQKDQSDADHKSDPEGGSAR